MLALLFSGHKEQAAPAVTSGSQPIASAPTATAAPAAQAASYYCQQPNIPATFARRMPMGNGTPVVTSNGHYNMNAIHVGVPSGFDGVKLLPGSDPAAMTYMAAQQAQQQSLTMDNGPINVDKSGLPPPGTMTHQTNRIGVPPQTN